MLTIYSGQGSPGASTTAMHLAALWASQDREVLLIEADPDGGSISHNLGIQFTPGSASFVASGQSVQSNHLIDHAQDVLFANLHVMPAPASPTGARGIFAVLADVADELRTISENEMAVIIDGGRISAETAASGLTAASAGTVVVCSDSSDLSSLNHLTDALSARPDIEAPAGFAVSVGKSPISDDDWRDTHSLTFGGSIETLSDTADLSVFLNRTKRKNKKWLTSLEQVGEALYPYAHPPMSNRPRRTSEDSAPDTQPAAEAEPVADEPVGGDPAVYGEAPQTVPDSGFPAYQPPMAPAAQGYETYETPHDPAQPHPQWQQDYPPAHYLPPGGWSDPQAGGAYPPAASPDPYAYGQDPAMMPQDPYGHPQPWPPQYPQQPYEQQQPGGQPPPQYPPQFYEQSPPPGPPPQYPQQPYEAQQPGGQPPSQYQPPNYEQPQPAVQPPPQLPPQNFEQSPPAGPPPQYPQQPYEAQQPGGQPSIQQPPENFEQPGSLPQAQPPAPSQPQAPTAQPEQPTLETAPPADPSPPPADLAAPPAPPAPPTAAPPADLTAPPANVPAADLTAPPADAPAPVPDIKPTGSFRDWAAKLHGAKAGDAAAQSRGY